MSQSKNKINNLKTSICIVYKSKFLIAFRVKYESSMSLVWHVCVCVYQRETEVVSVVARQSGTIRSQWHRVINVSVLLIGSSLRVTAAVDTIKAPLSIWGSSVNQAAAERW